MVKLLHNVNYTINNIHENVCFPQLLYKSPLYYILVTSFPFSTFLTYALTNKP